MTNKIYEGQVELLLKVLPEVAREDDFALHGGTAINLFIRNMDRLSVDIDLTYIPVEARENTLYKINIALSEIKTRLEKIIPKIYIQQKLETGKLLISLQGIQIKIEVNLVNRGLLAPAEKKHLCEKAQDIYDAFVAMQIVPFGQLYGGKICAALDRQNPRDLFDVDLLLANEGLTSDVITGFLLALCSHDRPMYEVLAPNLLDQKQIMENQFIGMTTMAFTYEDFEKTRDQIIASIHKTLTQKDKFFLIGFNKLELDWSLYNFEKFPAVQWKLQNLKKLKANNQKKYEEHLNLLEKCLDLSSP